MNALHKARALDIISKYSQASVLVIGDIMLDHFIWGKVARISPEAPVPVVDVQKENVLLGGCANVLNNIHAIGGQALGSGVIGADDMGRKLLGEFCARELETTGIVTEEGRPTTLKTRVVAHNQQVVRFDRESKKAVSAASIESILAYVEAKRHHVGAIVVSDYNKGLITPPLMAGMRKILAGTGVPVCIDPKRDDFLLYQGFDVITPNHLEAGKALSMELNDESAFKRAGDILMERYGFKAVLITRGEEGISLFECNDREHSLFPTKAREVFDVTGAGDTVIGVFALSLAAGASYKEAAALANNAAGIVVGKVGTATVSQEELIESL